MDIQMDIWTDAQIPPVFYSTLSPFGAKAQKHSHHFQSHFKEQHKPVKMISMIVLSVLSVQAYLIRGWV